MIVLSQRLTVNVSAQRTLIKRQRGHAHARSTASGMLSWILHACKSAQEKPDVFSLLHSDILIIAVLFTLITL